jgi:hypothetical protein
MHFAIRVLIFIILLLATGCEERSVHRTKTTAPAVTKTVHPAVPPNDLSLCGKQAEAKLSAQIAIHLFVAKSMDENGVQADLQRATQYFSDYGIRIKVASQTEIPRRPMLTVQRDEIDTENIKTSVKEKALERIRQFLLDHRSTQANDVHLVILPEILSSQSALAPYFSSLDGVTLSPFLSEGWMHEALGLKEYTPTVFLVHADQRKARKADADTLLAHEIGHAFGLAHHGEPSNLMSQTRRPDCNPVLNDEQILILRSAMAMRLD